MTADVTIQITVGSNGATVSQSTATSEPPAPMSLEQIQTSVAASAPSPQALEALTSGEVGATSETAPPPMPIEQLQMTAASSAAPEPFGTLTSGPGAAPPDSLGGFGASDSAPGPLPIDELGAPEAEQPEEGEKEPRSGRRERKTT